MEKNKALYQELISLIAPGIISEKFELSSILEKTETITLFFEEKKELIPEELLGKEVVFKDNTYNLFPSTQDIADASIDTLKLSKIGYRAPYLKESAKKLTQENLQDYKDQEEIRKWLISFPGIGPKVADCILLYSLGYQDVIPLDTWMQKIFIERYYLPTKYKYEDMRKWYKDMWGNKAGIIGQYLFEAYRT